jgi:hypothetical protein
MKITTRYYDYYLGERAKIIKQMTEAGGILDIMDVYLPEEFTDLGTLLSNEFPQMSEKQIARLMAERQTYYLTDKEATILDRGVRNLWEEMGIPEGERTKFVKEDLIFGTPIGVELHDKFFHEVDKLYKQKRSEGMSGGEASKYISKVIFDSP